MKLFREEVDGHLQLLMLENWFFGLHTRFQTSSTVNINPLFLQSLEMQIDFWRTLVIAMDDQNKFLP